MQGIPIKFRARRMNDGEYAYGQYFEQVAATGETSGQIVIEYTFNKKVFEYVYSDTVQQLVGYDAAGNEVYEGDELNCYHSFFNSPEQLKNKEVYSVVKARLTASLEGCADEDLNSPTDYQFLKKF